MQVDEKHKSKGDVNPLDLTLEQWVEWVKSQGPLGGEPRRGTQTVDEGFVEGGVDQGMSAEEWDRWWARFEAELKEQERARGIG